MLELQTLERQIDCSTYFGRHAKLIKDLMVYATLKNRRSGFSFMSSSETVNLATLASDSRFGILSKTGADAKENVYG
jgi:hypothetical protein